MEREAHIKVLNESFHKLINATQSNVLQIADRCLSRNLITSSTQKELLNTVGISPETKARKLLVAVRESMEHQKECFTIFLDILDDLRIFGDLTKEIRSALDSEKLRRQKIKETKIQDPKRAPDEKPPTVSVSDVWRRTGSRNSTDYFYYVLLVAVVSGLVTIIVASSSSWTIHNAVNSGSGSSSMLNSESTILSMLSNPEADAGHGFYPQQLRATKPGTLVVALLTVILGMVIIAAYWLWLVIQQSHASNSTMTARSPESLPLTPDSPNMCKNNFSSSSSNSPQGTPTPLSPSARTINESSINRDHSNQDDDDIEGEKLILVPHQSGERVVDMCIEKLRLSSFGNGMLKDNRFMKRTAYVMSDFGRNVQSSGGIWQVSYIGYQGTLDTGSHRRLPKRYANIWSAFGIDWKDVKYKDLEKPFYSALAARLHLSNIADFIPPENDIEKQAEYWKVHYMGGNGSTDTFIDKVHELEQ